jgi:energy-coupling factor transporter ATP-binding protein EcfA2
MSESTMQHSENNAAISMPEIAHKIHGHSDCVNSILDGFIKDINNIDEPIISQIAENLLDFDLARDFVHEVWQKRYSGNAGLCKALTISYACARCANTKGLYIVVTGPSGFGKSAGIKTMLKLIHPEYVDEGSDSEKAIYYEDLREGTIKYYDDVVWNNESGRTIKEAYTYFQAGIERNVAVKQKDGGGHLTEKQHGAKRLTFWATCVDNNADEQIRNRFLQHEVKADKEQLKAIHRHINQEASGKYVIPQEEIVETEICQQITNILGSQLYHVDIPFANRIEFHNTDPRTQIMFLDTIRASAVWNYRNRMKDEYGRLLAAIPDYYQALDMFESIGGQSANKFTQAEKSVLNAIISNGHKANSIEIQKIAGIGKQRLHQITYGRDQKNEQQMYGLASKCPQLILHTEVRPHIYELPEDFVLESCLNVELLEEKTDESMEISM